MHTRHLHQWRHDHNFSVIQQHGERRTIQVLLLTAVTMIVEITAGLTFGSMALLADGWHMGTHVAAFGITIFAYRYARRHADSARFSFGTGKVSVLGGFASAVALVVVAFMMALESIHRLFSPQTIRFNEAIGVAVLGLTVNLLSAWILQSHHRHEQGHGHGHHHDHNLRAAYLHVLADAFTSVLAIGALVAGKVFGWHWLDPVMGLVGAGVITKWAHGLVKETGSILLDGSIEGQTRERIVKTIEADRDNRVTDIHIWKVGPDHYAAVISIVTHYPQSADRYKQLIADQANLAHVTVEVIHCESEPCLPVEQP
ncbi:MAG: CDF family Co(II)/Ni(II) efflux transporter DmeF [Phycisphaerales bacterium]|nr:MAG: CDF family Co(II)/Ni(II) efflux transporter DmeF [Phycisphaerales bacterium]